jgi:L-arabinose isomerase
MQDNNGSGATGVLESFEITRGAPCGDLLTEARRERKLVVGLLGCGFFEYWRMYPGLQEKTVADLQHVADALGKRFDVVYPGYVDTLDKADAAGREFRDRNIDVLIVTEGTYAPDYFIHQVLTHLPESIPLCAFAYQPRTTVKGLDGYDEALRSSGLMGLVQLTGGFRKMGKYRNYEAVVGPLDAQSVAELERFVQVRQTIANLRTSTYGVIGHVFRGMFDFHFDKTAVTGVLGPQIIDIEIRHLLGLLEETSDKDARVTRLCDKVYSSYKVEGVEPADVRRSARLAVALQDLVSRYKLNGLVVLAQHLIELQANATTHLALTEIVSTDMAEAVTEGDVLGCIMSKVLKDFTGHTGFYGEYEEVDLPNNAIMFLGHGFIDVREARKDRPVKVGPACEAWGFEGNSLGFEATYPPGPVTMTHVIQDDRGWRLFVSEGEILDLPSLPISETSLIVRVKKPVREYLREVIMHGFAHHVITAPGNVTEHLECFGRQLGMTVCRI